MRLKGFFTKQAAEKHPYAAFPSSFPVSKHGAGLLRRTSKYVSLLRILGALHLGIFEQPVKNDYLAICLENSFQIPPNPPLLKGGEGGLTIFIVCG